jgi:hypothetical protein
MQMQCLACGAKMRLNQISDHDAMLAAGFEHRTFECSVCGDIERRLVFVGQSGSRHTDPDPVDTPSEISPANEAAAAPAFGKRILTKLFCAWRELAGRKRSSAAALDAIETQPPTPSREPMPESPAELVPQPTPALPHLIESLTVSTVPSASTLLRSDSDLDECEDLLRQAIGIVHGETRSSQAAANLTELGSAIPATTSAPVPAATAPLPVEQKSPLIAVQIRHDPEKGKFVATDTKSGLSILRHQDGAWLRAMCDRMGWQIVEVDAGNDEIPEPGVLS